MPATRKRRKRTWEDEIVEERGDVMASVYSDGEEDDEDEGRVAPSGIEEDVEDEVEIGSLQEIKNLIIHQLVISYNLSKVTQHIVDKVLNHFSREEEMGKKLAKIEGNVLEVLDAVEGEKSGWVKWAVVANLVLQVIILILLLLK